MTGTNYFADLNGGGTVIKLVASELAVSGNLTIMDGLCTPRWRDFYGWLVNAVAFEEPLIAGFYNNYC